MRKTSVIRLCQVALSAFLLASLLLITACSPSPKTQNTTKAPGSTTTRASTVETTQSEPDQGQVVAIKDPELEAIIRDKLDKPEGDILVSDMANLYSLNINNKETPVRQLDGLEYAVNLGNFSYRYGQLESLAPIANCGYITYLTISYSTVDELPNTLDMPDLRTVNFIETNVSDFSFLAGLTQITDLTLTRCGVSAIEFLSDFDDLVELNLSDNQIADIAALRDKRQLTSLNLHKNEVVNIDVLGTCTALQAINISYNHVANIEKIMDLPALQELTAYEELDQRLIDRNQLQELIDKGVSVDYHA